MCNCKCIAVITGSVSWMDGFDYWWEHTGVKKINPKTPASIVESYKKVAETAWNAAHDTRSRTDMAVVLKAGVACAP